MTFLKRFEGESCVSEKLFFYFSCEHITSVELGRMVVKITIDPSFFSAFEIKDNTTTTTTTTTRYIVVIRIMAFQSNAL